MKHFPNWLKPAVISSAASLMCMTQIIYRNVAELTMGALTWLRSVILAVGIVFSSLTVFAISSERYMLILDYNPFVFSVQRMASVEKSIREDEEERVIRCWETGDRKLSKKSGE